MRGDIEPIVVPGPAGDEYRRLQKRRQELEIEQAKQHQLKQLAQQFAKQFAGVLPGTPEWREIELAIEKHRSNFEKQAEPLKQGQAAWQKETGEIIQEILKLADNAAEMYEVYQEYPFSDNFEKYGEDKEKAAARRDFCISLINQAVALYYWKVIKELEKLKITDKPEFEKVQHCVNTLKAKMGERADLERAAAEFERQAGLARFQVAHSQERDRESRDHSATIQDLLDRVAIQKKHYPRRLLQAGNVEKSSEQAEERAKELEGVLEHVERHRRETEVKIASYIGQAQKRGNAVNDSTARQASVDTIRAESGIRFTDAQARTIAATARVTATPIGNTTYKDIAGRITSGTTTVQDTGDIVNLVILAGEAGTQSGEAEERARGAEERTREARTRAREAEERARIAKSYNNCAIKYELAKDVEKCAKKIEKLEEKVVENASLIGSKEKIIQNALTEIDTKIAEMQAIANTITARGTAATGNETERFQQLENEIEKAEMAKNSAMAFEEQAAKMEETVLNDIIDKLGEEFAALGREHPNATQINNLASVAADNDLTILQNLVNNQKALESALRGTPAVGGAPAVVGLIEREREQSRAARAIHDDILNRQNINANKAVEATCRTNVQNSRTNFATALGNVETAERNAAAALKRNAIHMERDVTGDADQAIEHLQKIKDNLADQDDEGLKNRSKGHIFIDPQVGKCTINGVWMSVREIDRWDFAAPDQTTIEYRPDIVKVEVETITREAQGGKLSVDPGSGSP